ncbi:MAG: 16S rRNA (adenine(1518)-N(6)/adenine(1519)-N(6))-dimethyltransferase RsmA [Candidatus Anstonellales archaeon]
MSKLGQVFLRDRRILEYISSHVSGRILEIGGGDGRLTRYLISKGEVWVVEIDSRFIQMLEAIAHHVIHADFLRVEPFDVDWIVGNIPYYISSPILFRLLDWNFYRAILMFQSEFVDKMLMKERDRKYGRLSVMAQYYFNITPLRRVSKYSFSPIPKVDSTIVMLEKIRARDTGFENFIRSIFTQKNKKLKNVLRGVDEKYAERRADELSLEELLELYKTYQ